MNASVAAGNFVGNLSLGHTAPDGLFNHFGMTFSTVFFKVFFKNDMAAFIIVVGADAGKRAHAVFMGPGAAAAAVASVDSFTAFNQRENFLTGNHNRI